MSQSPRLTRPLSSDETVLRNKFAESIAGQSEQMGHILRQNQQIQEAVTAWVTVYRLAKRLQLAQALQALERLAGSLGLPGGLAAWEALSQQRGE
jgi:hypothetical protein